MLNGWAASCVDTLNKTFITNTTEKIMTTKTVKKKASKKATKQEEPAINIILTSKCPTISGKSTLTYNTGADDDDKIFIRVFSNSGGGYFSKEWISLDHITSVLSDVTGEHITSINLIPLFKGKSVNTPGYLLAVLLKEGLLAPIEDKKRKYQFTGTDKFMAKVAKKAK